jgi:hypothetical protein
MEQAEMSFDPLNDPIFSEVAPHIVDEFRRWHVQNPRVWELFQKFAYQLWNSGRRRYGARSIIERIRWETDVQTAGSEFKIGDHCISCYARLMIVHDDRFKNFFRRKRGGDGGELE